MAAVHLFRRLTAPAAALAALALLAGCDTVASLDCGEIAEQAKQASQSHAMKIERIANAREISRAESDARCTAEAGWSDGENMIVYLRAYEEGDNVMIAYQATPFE